MVQSAFSSEVDRSIRALVDAVTSSPCSIATAESLTSGQLAVAISTAPNASNWYKGGVVAYQPNVKHGENAEVMGFEFAGEPIEIVEQTICAAFRSLAEHISSAKL
ncbi:CinA family protein [Neomicrococcus lactis]|uniref:Nicotinamide mononucleotide (NMN) deamidase PncC n=1 Tax=Neomicrococcus lactis TaxID=732241 RepID=A0A7W9DBF8_9MICC|nr:CinA family protein [Neomicrococcus lactis]MBB5598653.1 nicotinamide mononucleotide (NMN) deamidase PncC [Neomicrococcus lactis]